MLVPPNAAEIERRAESEFGTLPAAAAAVDCSEKDLYHAAREAGTRDEGPESAPPQEPSSEMQPWLEPEPEPELPPDSVADVLQTQRKGLGLSAPVLNEYLRNPALCRRRSRFCDVCDGDDAGKPVAGPFAQLPGELLVTVFSWLDVQDLCSVSQACRRLDEMVHAPSNDTVLWLPLCRRVAAHGVQAGTCSWRELFIRLKSIEIVSTYCRHLESSASSLLESVLPKLQSAQLNLLETLIPGPLNEFRSIEEPPPEVLFACDAMVLLCGADLIRAGASVHEWGCGFLSRGGGGGGSAEDGEDNGWTRFRDWFFSQEPCSFLGLRLWELDKNSLSHDAIAQVERAASQHPYISLSRVEDESVVAHCILQWVVALHGYYYAHRAMTPLIETTALLKQLSREFVSVATIVDSSQAAAVTRRGSQQSHDSGFVNA